MKRADHDIVVIGAGAAGLAATFDLSLAGKDVCCLEAAGRVGGRILTVRDRESALPIELGAEFIHGRPAEIWGLIQTRSLRVYERSPRAVHLDRGHIRKEIEIGDIADNVLGTMAKSARKHDESFEQYLHRSRHSQERKEWARFYVEGFNAARSDRISAGSLEREAEAADRIDGGRAFCFVDGYDSIPMALLEGIPNHRT